MNIFLNEYFGFCFELNFELNHFWAKFNEKMNFQNVSNRAIFAPKNALLVARLVVVARGLYLARHLSTFYYKSP